MVLLSAQGLCKAYGDRTLFSDVSFDVRDGERIGLVGVNGAGKTTLLNIFTGETPADAGRARVFGGASLGHMRQHVPGDLTRTLYDEAMEVFRRFRPSNASLPRWRAPSTKAAATQRRWSPGRTGLARRTRQRAGTRTEQPALDAPRRRF